MSGLHLTADVLSAYLDRELPAPEAVRVEEHLEGCDRCRHQLDGLTTVVGRLRGLERLAPPQILEMDVQRRIALTAPRRNWLDQFDLRLGRLPVQPGVMVTFALVFAFAAILYTFAQGLEDHQPSTIPVVFGTAEIADPTAPTLWTWQDGAWQAGSWAAEPEAEIEQVERDSAEWRGILVREPALRDLVPRLEPGDLIRLSSGDLLELGPVSEPSGSPLPVPIEKARQAE